MEVNETIQLTEEQKRIINGMFEDYQHAMNGAQDLIASLSRRKEFIWGVIRQMYPEKLVNVEQHHYNIDTGVITAISKDDFDWEDMKSKFNNLSKHL